MLIPAKPALKLQALPREARDTLFLLGVIALILLPQIPNLPWWCSTLAAVVLLWRGTLARAGQARCPAAGGAPRCWRSRWSPPSPRTARCSAATPASR